MKPENYHVNIGSLKRDIISLMDTGYDSDKRLCIDILNVIDRHTFKDNPFPCDPEYTGIQNRAENMQKRNDQDREFKPLTYADIKDDPYYYLAPEQEVK